jgi:folate-binding protein YgfZ
MIPLPLHDFHSESGARFAERNGVELVANYGDVEAEYQAVRDTAGIVDLSFRSRICLLGADRQKFLNGQVTNNVKDLKPGEGCYAALITAKGKMQSDLRVFCLEEELLLDFEPGLTQTVTERLEKYIIADDVQLVDVAPHYGLISLQGPKSPELASALDLGVALPGRPFGQVKVAHDTLGDLYIANDARLGTAGIDLYVPTATVEAALMRLLQHASSMSVRLCGSDAFEMARIEQGIPRFTVDMDETNLPPEAGLDRTGISYTKGCYIGQEVIARIRTYGQVAKKLCRLEITDSAEIPVKGAKLYLNGKDVGFVTSAAQIPISGVRGLGYVRREANAPGTELLLANPDHAAGKARILAHV